MKSETNKRELILGQSNPEAPSPKVFVGEKSEFVIENWSMEKDISGN